MWKQAAPVAQRLALSNARNCDGDRNRRPVSPFLFLNGQRLSATVIVNEAVRYLECTYEFSKFLSRDLLLSRCGGHFIFVIPSLAILTHPPQMGLAKQSLHSPQMIMANKQRFRNNNRPAPLPAQKYNSFHHLSSYSARAKIASAQCLASPRAVARWLLTFCHRQCFGICFVFYSLVTICCFSFLYFF